MSTGERNFELGGGIHLCYFESFYSMIACSWLYISMLVSRDLGRRVNQAFEGRPNLFRAFDAISPTLPAAWTWIQRYPSILYEFMDGFNEVTSVHLARGVL